MLTLSNAIDFLSDLYDRVIRDADPRDRSGIRRAFVKAKEAAKSNDIRPAILLAARYS